MSNVVITQAGALVVTTQRLNGVLVAIDKFKIGSNAGFTPSSSQTEISNIVYEGGIVTGELTASRSDDNKIRYRVKLLESTGDFNVGHIGLYLTDGTLFAIAVSSVVQSKVSSNHPVIGNVLTYDIMLDLTGTSVVDNFEIITDERTSVPEASELAGLPSAVSSPFNLYCVRNEASFGNGVAIVESFRDYTAFTINSTNTLEPCVGGLFNGTNATRIKKSSTSVSSAIITRDINVDVSYGVGGQAQIFFYLDTDGLANISTGGNAFELKLSNTAGTETSSWIWAHTDLHVGTNVLTFDVSTPDATTGGGVDLEEVEKTIYTITMAGAAYTNENFILDEFSVVPSVSSVTTIEGFENHADWTVTTTGNTILSTNTTDEIHGTGCIAVEKTNAEENFAVSFYKDVTAFDVNTIDKMSLWFRIPDQATLDYILLMSFSFENTIDSTFNLYGIVQSQMKIGWNVFIFDPKRNVTPCGAEGYTGIDRIKIDITCDSGDPDGTFQDVLFDLLSYEDNRAGLPVISVTNGSQWCHQPLSPDPQIPLQGAAFNPSLWDNDVDPGMVVYFDATSEKFEKMDLSFSTVEPEGVRGPYNNLVPTGGFIKDSSWSWTPGDTIYLSSTPGELSTTRSKHIIGRAITSDRILVNIKRDDILQGMLIGFWEWGSNSTVKLVRSYKGEIKLELDGVIYTKSDGDLTFDITTDLETGVEANSTFYYCYVRIIGGLMSTRISVTPPVLTGSNKIGYHPTQTSWRYVGMFYNQANGHIIKFTRDSNMITRLAYHEIATDSKFYINMGTSIPTTYTYIDLSTRLPATAEAVSLNSIISSKGCGIAYGPAEIYGLSVDSSTRPRGVIQVGGASYDQAGSNGHFELNVRTDKRICYAYHQYSPEFTVSGSANLRQHELTITAWRENLFNQGS